jgi:hypothetical protein
MRRRLFLLSLLAPVAGVGWFFARNRLDVVNRSGQKVEALTVNVCDRTFSFGEVLPGASVSTRFGRPDHESTFDIGGKMEDGTLINESCGYVVWEDIAQTFQIVICPSGEITCMPH